MTVQAMRAKAIKLVRNILIARRNSNVKAEQLAHEVFTDFCEDHNLDFDTTFNGAQSVLKKSIANNMNGFI